MSALLLLFFCLAMGIAVTRYARPPAGLAQNLNWWVLNIALPALVLDLIPRIRFDPHLWFLVATMWLLFIGSWLLFALLGPRLGWSRGRIGALILVGGLGNTSFMGYPMIEALRGKEGLGLAVIADQVGNFVALAVGGVAVTAVYAGRTLMPAEVLRRILLFPSFLALVGGIIAGALGGWPEPVHLVLERIGASLTPLALFSVGLQFRLHLGRSQLGALGMGLGWKMFAAPLLCWLLGIATGVSGLVLTVGVLQAAMAPMISAAILAEQYEMEPELANTVLGAGILLSLVTVPLANLLL
ncbi:AEC family transporter [Nevskia soli]|jgi:malate permease and related proteins|uniref:AEC family transporter n=1 Tax=Nevskia soli TaxID=418856 RepID=UPI0004A761AD|nr:AEC family transporter [Nevskia soli]